MKDGKTKFIRKNGRVIPIKEKDSSGRSDKLKKINSEMRASKKKVNEIESRSKKFGSIGALAGAAVSVARGSFSTASIVTNIAIGAAIAGIYAGGGREKTKEYHKQSDLQEKKKLIKNKGTSV